MIQHARSLPIVANGQEPSTYVKVYLQPDPTKATKRKTKVVRRSCHPSFMEMVSLNALLFMQILKPTYVQWNVLKHKANAIGMSGKKLKPPLRTMPAGEILSRPQIKFLKSSISTIF